MDTSSSDSNTTANADIINDNEKTKVVKITIDDLENENQTVVSDEKVEVSDNGQPIVQLGKVELLLVMLGYVKNQFILAQRL